MSTTYAKVGELARFNGLALTVLEPCHGELGFWACLPHGLTMPSNVLMAAHESKRGAHELVWLCPIHGLEAGDVDGQ